MQKAGFTNPAVESGSLIKSGRENDPSFVVIAMTEKRLSCEERAKAQSVIPPNGIGRRLPR